METMITRLVPERERAVQKRGTEREQERVRSVNGWGPEGQVTGQERAVNGFFGPVNGWVTGNGSRHG